MTLVLWRRGLIAAGLLFSGGLVLASQTSQTGGTSSTTSGQTTTGQTGTTGQTDTTTGQTGTTSQTGTTLGQTTTGTGYRGDAGMGGGADAGYLGR